VCAALRTKKKSAPSRNGTHRTRIDIASIRREEIIAAAIEVITHDGIEKLSLKKIEDLAGMSRGQLTYYFRTKEQILLAVFDRLLEMMYERIADGMPEKSPHMSGWEMTRHLLASMLNKPPVWTGFHSLEYTFLSEIGHREDFRERLAGLYEEWRSNLSKGLENDLNAGAKPAPPRAIASLVQAILHGLAVQMVADPAAFDRTEMLQLCTDLLGGYLNKKAATNAKPSKQPAPSRRQSKRGGSKASG